MAYEKPQGPVTQYGVNRWDQWSFLSEIRKRALARTERFEVQVKFPPGISAINPDTGQAVQDCSLFCEEVQIPGMTLANKEFNLGPWTHYRNNNVAFLGNEINLTFYVDDNWLLRHYFESWMRHCVDTTSKEVTYPVDTWGEISINTLDMKNRYKSSWILHEVTPKVLNLIPLSMGSVGIARATLIVSAAYWESSAVRVNIGKPDNFESTEPEQNETRTKVRNWVLDLFGMGKKEEDNGSDPVLDESGD
jgi:hypothetical protein